MYDNNLDYIKFNAGRWYGKIRYPYLATNWKQVYRGHGIQKVHVFTNEKIAELPQLHMYLKEPHPYRHLNNTNVKFSQAKQDVTVYNMFQKENGFFIEMGAFNGITYSNTLWLERQHNWTGLLIEANPESCKSIDNVKRRAWRLCGCISSEPSTAFIKGGALGGAHDTVDKDHMKLLNKNLTITVACFNLVEVLEKINRFHINYFSLDVEGGELFILNTMKSELKSRKIMVDIWTIEYRVWDGKKIIVDKSKNNLKNLRKFFADIGGYTEHSQLTNSKMTNISDGMALDVVFVNNDVWCGKYQKLPNNSNC